MNNIKRTFLTAVLLSCCLLCGCGGEYILTAPDNVGVTAKDVTVVARLQRSDVWMLNLPMRDAMMRFQIDDGDQYAATTDKLGYVGINLPAELHPGKYSVRIDHQDTQGDEVSQICNAYIWASDKPVVAVDMDSLEVFRLFGEMGHSKNIFALFKSSSQEGVDIQQDTPSLVSVAALRKIQTDANVIYLTRRDAAEHTHAKELLDKYGYPGGPVLSWRRQNWHVVAGKYNIPKVVVESRLISQLELLKKDFKKLSWGICDSSLAQEAFEKNGMKVIRTDRDESLWESMAINGFSFIAK